MSEHRAAVPNGDRKYGSRPIALWATPRAVSTAFERMMIERGDHVVLDEPFSRAYYYGPERSSHRFTDDLPDSGYDDVLAEIRAAGSGSRDAHVFFKDMAYHLGPYADACPLDEFQNTFLIRDPAWAIPSLARIWEDFTEDETGYRAMECLVINREERARRPAVVIDSDELCAAPERVVKQWCAEVGIDFMPDALSWKPGMQPEWKLWRDWYTSTAESRGFRRRATGDAPPEPDSSRVREAIDAARPVYERLLARTA